VDLLQKPTKHIEEVFSYMIKQNGSSNQLPNEIKSAFDELKILQYLRKAGFKKKFGFTCSYLFQLVFTLIFYHKNWFQLLESNKGDLFPAKDAVYRFLNHCGYAWRRFLSLLSAAMVSKVRSLGESAACLILDDSMFDKNRSKAVELLARCFDHAKGRFCKGFRMLTLGWSDGKTFIPLDFALLSSKKAQINGSAANIDKRSSGYKRRLEALKSAPELIPEMIKRALAHGVMASHVLMDSWFTFAPLIKAITEQGLDVIGMLKNGNQRYRFGNRSLSLKELYQVATPVAVGKKGILRSVRVQMMPDIPVLIVFVRNRTKKNEWLAILSTDCELLETEIIQLYGIRWDIEIFFKCTKSLLQLEKEFQGRSYDLLISHTTIVFTRYILLSWQQRCNTDQRTLGGLFAQLADEINELDWAVALNSLLELLSEISNTVGKQIRKFIDCQLRNWFAGLPNYIKAYLPNLCCES
jgi:hypothetical protein